MKPYKILALICVLCAANSYSYGASKRNQATPIVDIKTTRFTGDEKKAAEVAIREISKAVSAAEKPVSSGISHVAMATLLYPRHANINQSSRHDSSVIAHGSKVSITDVQKREDGHFNVSYQLRGKNGSQTNGIFKVRAWNHFDDQGGGWAFTKLGGAGLIHLGYDLPAATVGLFHPTRSLDRLRKDVRTSYNQ